MFVRAFWRLILPKIEVLCGVVCFIVCEGFLILYSAKNCISVSVTCLTYMYVYSCVFMYTSLLGTRNIHCKAATENLRSLILERDLRLKNNPQCSVLSVLFILWSLSTPSLSVSPFISVPSTKVSETSLG